MRKEFQVWCLTVILLAIATPLALTQDAREALGPKDQQAKSKEVHPLTGMMTKLNSSLRPELRATHPRVYVTDEELQPLRERSQTTHRDLWQRALQNIRALKKDPPAAPAQERRAQNEVGLGIAEAAFAYKIEGEAKSLAAAKNTWTLRSATIFGATPPTSRTLISPLVICFMVWAGAMICSITI